MLRRCVVSIVVGGLADLPKLCGVLFAGGLVVELKPSAATAVIEPTCSRLQSGRLHVVQHRNIVQRVGCIERTCNRCLLWLWLRRPSITVRRVIAKHQPTDMRDSMATVRAACAWESHGFLDVASSLLGKLLVIRRAFAATARFKAARPTID